MYVSHILTISEDKNNKIFLTIENTGEVTYIEETQPCTCGKFFVRPLILNQESSKFKVKLITNRRVKSILKLSLEVTEQGFSELCTKVANHTSADYLEVEHLLYKVLLHYGCKKGSTNCIDSD